MANPTGKNRRTDCHICGNTERDSACEAIKCGWYVLPPRSEILDDYLDDYVGDDLWDADPDCEHVIVCASGGGIKCVKCL